MNVNTYRKNPVTIHAVQFDGGNHAEIKAFAGDAANVDGGGLTISTLEGVKTAHAGDFIIRGVNGEFYPCSAETFNANNTHVDGNAYRKNASAVVTAIQFTGDNFPEIVTFTQFDPDRTATEYDAAAGTCAIPHPGNKPYTCHTGDYVIRNGGSVYPCEPEIFTKTYIAAD